MSSLDKSVETSNSNWKHLSSFICPSYTSIHDVQLNPTKGTSDGFQLMFEDVDEDLFEDSMPTVELVFQRPHIFTVDVGVQTMPTSIPRFPVACRSHPVPCGLDTESDSPLTVHDITADHSYNGNKRKLEDSNDLCEYSTLPTRKRLALGDQDPFHLNNLFDFLKFKINNMGNSNSYVVEINEVGVGESQMDEGFVEVACSNFDIRSIATNTMHVPLRIGLTQCSRYKVWSHTAKQFLSEKDRVDKRGPKQDGRINRMANLILDYYCRLKSL